MPIIVKHYIFGHIWSYFKGHFKIELQNMSSYNISKNRFGLIGTKNHFKKVKKLIFKQERWFLNKISKSESEYRDIGYRLDILTQF